MWSTYYVISPTYYVCETNKERPAAKTAGRMNAGGRAQSDAPAGMGISMSSEKMLPSALTRM